MARQDDLAGHPFRSSSARRRVTSHDPSWPPERTRLVAVDQVERLVGEPALAERRAAPVLVERHQGQQVVAVRLLDVVDVVGDRRTPVPVGRHQQHRIQFRVHVLLTSNDRRARARTTGASRGRGRSPPRTCFAEDHRRPLVGGVRRPLRQARVVRIAVVGEPHPRLADESPASRGPAAGHPRTGRCRRSPPTMVLPIILNTNGSSPPWRAPAMPPMPGDRYAHS